MLLVESQIVAVSLTESGRYEIIYELLDGMLMSPHISSDKVLFVVEKNRDEDWPASLETSDEKTQEWEVKGGLNTIKKILRGLGKTVVC